MKTQEERKRKMLLVLPVLLLPFLALGFYALGGGKGAGQAQSQQVGKGLNTYLPGAQLKGQQPQDKMALYDKAKRDFASANSVSGSNAFAALGWDTVSQIKPEQGNDARTNEVRINQKLSEINRQISQPATATRYANNYPNANSTSPDMDRLEKLLKKKSQGNAEDPEMKQLGTMLDKIMQIQNPSLVKEKQQTGQTAVKDSAFKAIPAMIDGNQKVAPGGVVNLRLRDTITLNGITIPKGQSLSGSCIIANQRLLLDIKNIRLGTAIIPVNLTVFALDGLPGINAPEAELSEAAVNGANGALANMEFLSMNQAFITQAATAGINAAKGLLGKKAKKIRVKLKGDQAVLLRNNQLK